MLRTILARKVRSDRHCFRMGNKKVGGLGRVLAALERKLLTEDTEREKNQVSRIFP